MHRSEGKEVTTKKTGRQRRTPAENHAGSRRKLERSWMGKGEYGMGKRPPKKNGWRKSREARSRGFLSGERRKTTLTTKKETRGKKIFSCAALLVCLRRPLGGFGKHARASRKRTPTAAGQRGKHRQKKKPRSKKMSEGAVGEKRKKKGRRMDPPLILKRPKKTGPHFYVAPKKKEKNLRTKGKRPERDNPVVVVKGGAEPLVEGGVPIQGNIGKTNH